MALPPPMFQMDLTFPCQLQLDYLGTERKPHY